MVSKEPSHPYSQEAEGILGVSEEKVAAVGAATMFQPLPKHQVPASEGAPSGNSPSRSMALQESEKGNQNLSIGKPSREPRFQACRFLIKYFHVLCIPLGPTSCIFNLHWC